MRESPRLRRLRSDQKALTQLAAESSIFTFAPHGDPPDLYVLRFAGRGFWRADHTGEVLVHDTHEVHIRLGASYPRTMPELAWKSVIFHPNISASGVVCLGGYGTYWVPSLTLDELCTMLWDMIRYQNYDETSPYNREAAAWVKNQDRFRLPIDNRPLRDRLAGYEPQAEKPKVRRQQAGIRSQETGTRSQPMPPVVAAPEPIEAEVVFLDDSPRRPVQPAPSREDNGVLFIE